MARELNSVQAERAGRSHIAPVTFVKITTYSDRPATTIDQVFYLADRACNYDYGNVGIDRMFLPVILGGSDFFSGFSHIPKPDDLTAFSSTFDLRCSNTEINGSRFVAQLQAHNLEDASVEISQLLLDSIDSLPLDLTGYKGDEHTVLFRGRVNQVAPITDTMVTIQCTPDLPSLAGWWIYLTDESKVDPLDLGKRAPMIYGNAKRIPLVNQQVGWVTTLVDSMTDSETGWIDVSDGTGLPGTGTVRVDAEEIDVANSDDTRFQIADLGDRGVNGTADAAHEAGAVVSELAGSAIYLTGWQEIDALNALYMINPLNGLLTRLDNSVTPWTTVTNPGSVQISDTQMSAILSHLKVQDAGSIGFGLRFFADIDGFKSPVAPERMFQVENFEVGTWEGANCTVELSTDRATSLTQSLKVSVDLDSIASAAIQSETTANWTGTNCTVSAVNTESHTEGSYCIEADSDGAGSVCLLEFYDAALGLDLEKDGRFESTGYESIVLDFKIKKAGTGGSVDFWLGTGDGTNTRRVDITVGDFPENSWRTIVFSPADMAVQDGTLDWADINYLAVGFNEPTRSADCKIYVDNIRTAPRNHVAQQNAMGGRNYDAYSDNIYLDLWKDYTEELSDLLQDRGDLIISEDEVSGTTLPDNYRWQRCVFDGNFEAWHDWYVGAANDVGAATDATNVHTLRFVLRTPGGVHSIDPTVVWYIDNLRREYEEPTDYFRYVGDVMHHPADIIRHWVEEVGGEKLDMASYATLHTSLTSAVLWGFDVRSLGFTWEEVLQRMCFEARCNIVAIETPYGRVWKLLHADNDYGFGAAPSGSVITQTHAMTDVGRSVDDIASHFTFRYAYDASLPGGGTEENYKLALVANPDDSDVPITTTLIGNAVARFGARDSGPIAFRCIQGDPAAEDVAGYLVQERMANDRRVFELREVAWFDALPHDVGDIVSITAPWASSATTCRITSMSKAFESNAWTITAVEVLTTGTRTP